MKITMIGSGYVGLVSGACLAEFGNNVLCLDIDHHKIEQLQAGKIPIHEPGLAKIVQNNLAAGRLQFTTDVKKSVDHGMLQFIAVGTPADEDGTADTQYVLTAASNIGRYMTDTKIIINKSTVPVGTADIVSETIKRELSERNLNLEFDVASNPEFLKEGAAVDDFMKPDRIIIGTNNLKSIEKLKSLYAPFQRNHERMLIMDVRAAELTKYAANAMLATRISFMNEIALLAEKLGADIESVRLGIGADPRIGYDFLYAGCGYGGSCFPKDVKALKKMGQNIDQPMHLIAAVEKVNENQKSILVQKIKAQFNGDIKGRQFAIWGLAFKPNTDDMREAPSRVIINALLDAGASVLVYDPIAITEAKRLFGNTKGIFYADTPMAALNKSDALIIVTEWKEFRSPDFIEIKNKLKLPLIFDGRNLYNPAELKAAGFAYFGIGRD
jgi:UDPglucose 6-dehydrogenase